MLQVGKKYNVAQPESAVILGCAPIVKILKKTEEGFFIGDNNEVYRPDGKHVDYEAELLFDFNIINLVSEVDNQS